MEKGGLKINLGVTLKRLFQARDELSFYNIRLKIWPILLIFPLTVIVGDLRFFNLEIEKLGLQSFELMLYPLGLGWLVLAFIPEKFILHLLRLAAVCCVLLLPFQLIFQYAVNNETIQLIAFMAFQFFIGICTACAFLLFCFKYNNIERLLGVMIIIFYYSLFYIFYRNFPIVQVIYKSWGGALVVVFYLFVVFAGTKHKHEEINETKEDPKGSGALLCIIFFITYYMIMCMINYIEFAEKIIYNLPYGLGQFAAVLVVFLMMLLMNNNALYIWLMFLVFSFLGISILIYDSQAAYFAGSLVYGLGDGLGYIITYYLCAFAIKRSKSIKIYKIYCVVFFVQYFIISGLYSFAFDRYEGPKHELALGIVIFTCSACLLLFPILQRKLFDSDWTDGLQLKDIEEYSQSLAETREINAKDSLNLTNREQEIFTMLLTGMNPKEIAYTLKISYFTVDFHRKNLYRKLKIKSRAELFSMYSGKNG